MLLALHKARLRRVELQLALDQGTEVHKCRDGEVHGRDTEHGGGVLLAVFLPLPNSGAKDTRRVAAVSMRLSGSSWSNPRAMKREAAVVAMVVVALVETRRAGPANPRLGSEGGLTEGDPLATQSCPISCR